MTVQPAVVMVRGRSPQLIIQAQSMVEGIKIRSA